MNKKNKYNQLLPFYIDLLTAKQRQIIEYYLYEDYSLSEISQNVKTSRSNVYDTINRVQILLDYYEYNLKLKYKYDCRIELFNNINKYNNKDINNLIDKYKEIEEE